MIRRRGGTLVVFQQGVAVVRTEEVDQVVVEYDAAGAVISVRVATPLDVKVLQTWSEEPPS